MAALGAIAGIIGTGLQVIGTIQDGKAQQAALNYEAQQEERAAKEERAASQRAAIEKRDEADFVLSRQRALAAASGAGVQTPTILDIYGDTAAKGEYIAQGELYGGESRARGRIDKANAARAKGKAAAKGSILEGFGTAFGGLSRIYG